MDQRVATMCAVVSHAFDSSQLLFSAPLPHCLQLPPQLMGLAQ